MTNITIKITDLNELDLSQERVCCQNYIEYSTKYNSIQRLRASYTYDVSFQLAVMNRRDCSRNIVALYQLCDDDFINNSKYAQELINKLELDNIEQLKKLYDFAIANFEEAEQKIYKIYS